MKCTSSCMIQPPLTLFFVCRIISIHLFPIIKCYISCIPSYIIWPNAAEVLLCHSILLPQGRSPLPALVTHISLFRTGPAQGRDINPLCVCSLCVAVPLRSATCFSGWGLVIELSVALFWLAIALLFFFFSFSAPKSWPIYSNPIIIEAWLSGVIDGTLSEPGYCWHTCCFGYTATD